MGAAGGYSGARFWKIRDQQQTWCLRRWPAPALGEERRLRWIHRQLATAREKGCHFVPVPVPAFTRETLVEFGDHLWQLEPWMPGVADFCERPEPQRLRAAMSCLARFHKALRSSTCRREASSGIHRRIDRLAEWFDGHQITADFLHLEQAAARFPWEPGFGKTVTRICSRFRALAPGIHERLLSVRDTLVNVQTVIADIWHDHVFFVDDEVTGFVDFGAMRMDTPACDAARLLGSLVADDANLRQLGLAVWSKESEIEPAALDLVPIFDDSGTLMSGLNWLQWICVEERRFGDLRPVAGRLRSIASRMDFLAACL
jgi:homoserine kinase type II